MICRIDELKDKQVVCVKNGSVIGNVSDVEINSDTGQLTSLIIYGKGRLLGIFGRESDIVIPWADIKVIGNETILVATETLCGKF